MINQRYFSLLAVSNWWRYIRPTNDKRFALETTVREQFWIGNHLSCSLSDINEHSPFIHSSFEILYTIHWFGKEIEKAIIPSLMIISGGMLGVLKEMVYSYVNTFKLCQKRLLYCHNIVIDLRSA